MALLTTQQAADALKVHRSRVLQLINEGRIPATKFGFVWMIDASELSKFKRQPTGWPKGRPRKKKPTPRKPRRSNG